MNGSETKANVCLAMLRHNGWLFYPCTRDGELVQIEGTYRWPGSGTRDTIRVRGDADADAFRLDGAGEVVWQRDGGVVELVEELMTLPKPSHRLAPRLALGVRAPELWIPGRPL
ncbi:hypothetical protein [Amycolatopsis sp. CA-230715]|uniref:hypothetical protein n=1 Tax=Amycolatopsis sp. CA-230715 TaxID=2745196 RepID=UPI001C00F70B|nr:hypothetical protein [Amycolatopsis sp. CA-230715]QWF81121.1 hypothetical protein HUW46_04547 [Amycolatopsis sp. CA-230715]